MLWHVTQNIFRQITMRIYNANPVASVNIVDDHGFKQGAFAHTAFTNDVDMAEAIIYFDAKFTILMTKIS